MNKEKIKFRIVDGVYILMIVLPLVFGMVLQVLTKPASEGISISGARIFFKIPMPIQDFLITESQINSALVMIVILGICLYLSHGLSPHVKLKRQHFAEMIVEMVDSLVNESMGDYFKGFSPFIIGMLGLSALSSLITLLGLYPPTSDINIVGGWAILVFFLITYYKFKCGPVNYMKSFTQPVALLTPINLISEVATPVSMAFRHYGNVLSGSVIAVLVSTGLSGVSKMVFGSLPGTLSDIPLFQIGIPAVLSLYFDIFSGCLQAFIFAMLTMMYVSGAFMQDEYEKRKAARAAKNKNK